MSNFIVQFPLLTERWEDDVLNKRFEIGRHIYNCLVTVTQKRYKEMIKTKIYRSAYSELVDTNKEIEKLSNRKKDFNEEIKSLKQKRSKSLNVLNALRKRYDISEYSFHNDVKNMQKHFKTHIDSFTAQKIATALWRAYKDLLFGEGKTIHYKKYGTFNSLEGKSNKTGIKYAEENIVWNGLKLPVKINKNSLYELQSLRNEIVYCRIVRKFVRKRYKFYVQIVFKGSAPIKVNAETGEVKHPLGSGDVGLDIGTQTIAISSETTVNIFELADRVQNIENQKRMLLRKMDRSRRAMNPNNFNSDGTIKKQGNKKVVWKCSNRYVKNQNALKELYRKQADIRKLQHEILANYIISLGDNIFVETMNFKGLQKRSTKTEKNDNGKFKKKKRFGKSLANKAPAMLLDIIDRKLNQHDRKLIKINTWTVKASQYNHVEDGYKKKKLSMRWDKVDGQKVQRDMYSSFIIMNVSDNLKIVDKTKCDERFENFLKHHELEVERLKGNKNLNSISI